MYKNTSIYRERKIHFFIFRRRVNVLPEISFKISSELNRRWKEMKSNSDELPTSFQTIPISEPSVKHRLIQFKCTHPHTMPVNKIMDYTVWLRTGSN